MIRPRVIPCLLLKGKGLVKTLQFNNPVYLGDPINTINIFNKKMVDEMILIDIDASKLFKKPNFDLILRISSVCFSPITYGGGINHLNDVENLFKIGIEKISMNTAAFQKPSFVTELAKRYGSQSVVVSININKDFWGKDIIVNNGKVPIDIRHSIQKQIKFFEDIGAGEILINDVFRDGTRKGYNIDLIKNISSNVTVPVIACGGCGSIKDLKDVITNGGASAAAAGSLFVFNGPHNAVLISYPDRKTIRNLFT